MVIEGPIAADCLDSLVAADGAGWAAGAIGALGVGAVLRSGSACGLKAAGSSFGFFHTLGSPSFREI
jgi:hypothetical protein